MAANERALAALGALGALWMVSQDGPDRWELRRPRFIGVALLSSCGIALGTWVGGGTWGKGVVLGGLAVTAIVAGYIEASRHAAAGMCLLLGAIVGAGVPSHRSPFIVLVLDGLAWMQVPSRRPQALYDAARDAAAAYRAATVATPALERHVLRRHALRSVHLGRLRVEEVRRELIARRRDGAAITEDFAAIERAINDHTRSLLAP